MSPDDVYQVRIERRSRFLGDGFLVDGGLVGGFPVDPAFVVTTAAAVREDGPSVELRAPGSGAGDSGADAPVAAEVVEVLGEDGLALLEVAAPGYLVLARPAEPSTELNGAGLPARAVGDELLRFRRLGAAHLRAELEGLVPFPAARRGSVADAADSRMGVSGPHLGGTTEKLGSGKGGGGESSTARIAQGQAGGGQRAESEGLAAGSRAAAGSRLAAVLDAGGAALAGGHRSTRAGAGRAGAGRAGAGRAGAGRAGDCGRGAVLRERARSGRLDPMVTVPAPGVREGSR